MSKKVNRNFMVLGYGCAKIKTATDAAENCVDNSYGPYSYKEAEAKISHCVKEDCVEQTEYSYCIVEVIAVSSPIVVTTVIKKL